MKHRKRLDKLAGQLRTMATDRARAVSYRSCVGLERDDLVLSVAKSVRELDIPILKVIIDQTTDYAARGRPHPDGTRCLHGFVVWIICDLVNGWSSLPAEIPTGFLTAWSKGYERAAGWNGEPRSPVASLRCEDCYLVYPNRDASGEWGGPDICLVCGSTRLSGRVYFRSGAFSLDGGCTVIEADAWTRK